MHRSVLFAAALAASALAGCSGGGAPGSMAGPAAYDQCRQLALSGGYPAMRGGSSGSNSLMEELPGMPPLLLGGFGVSDIQNHLDEQDYIESWCRRGRR
jgi:hypothetical protein